MAEKSVPQASFVIGGRGDHHHFADIHFQAEPLRKTDIHLLTQPKLPFLFGSSTAQLLLSVMNFWLKIDANPAFLQSIGLHPQYATHIVVLDASGGLSLTQLELAMLVEDSRRNFGFDSGCEILSSSHDRPGVFGGIGGNFR